MKSILEEFAYGNISPQARPFKRESAYGRAVSAAAESEEKLLARLGGEDRVLLQALIDAQGELEGLSATGNLIWGFKLGLLMAAEAFFTSEDLFADE